MKNAVLSAALGYIIVASIKWNMTSAMVVMGITLSLLIWDILIKIDVYVDKAKRSGKRKFFV